jgi:hydrogenase expression/formation protein HypC
MCLAIPGKIIDIEEKDGLPMGKVDFGGISKDVCLSYTPEAAIGQYVIVHVGFALSMIDEEEANEVLSLLQEGIEQLEQTPEDAP